MIELRALAIGVLLVGLLLLAVRRFAGNYLVDELAKEDAVKAGGSRRLEHPRAGARGSRVGLDHPRRHYAPGRLVRGRQCSRRTGAPRRGPGLGEGATTYGIAAVAVLALVLVAPQLSRGWLSALVLIGLVVAGIEVVRSIVMREAKQPA